MFMALLLSACGLHPMYAGGANGAVAQGLAAIGGKGIIADAPWPPVDPALLVEDQVTVAIQVLGKLRDTVTVAKGLPREELEALALASDKVQRALDGKAVKKVIVVPDRLVNLVA